MTFYLHVNGTIGVSLGDGRVINSLGTAVPLDRHWSRTSDFSEDDLTFPAALALASRIKARAEMQEELLRASVMVEHVRTICSEVRRAEQEQGS